MAKLAVLVSEGELKREQLLLARILDFFGVPSDAVDAAGLAGEDDGAGEQVWFGTAETIAAVLKRAQGSTQRSPAAIYAYLGADRDAGERALQFLAGKPELRLHQAPEDGLEIRVSNEQAAIAGPMAGVELRLHLRREDTVMTGVSCQEPGFAAIISAGGDLVFVRLMRDGVPIFFCASSYMPDIDQAVGRGFYDIKEHFCSAVPLVMFVRHLFKEVAWRANEIGAALIIDDPLLKSRYGACDFRLLGNLMRQYGFTTNVAFIPWNWRRTSKLAAGLFGREPGSFSVSIHGCDHIGGEFGNTSPAVLNVRARLAQSRMRNHQARTGIRHDPVMVFPQGVFSSVCPEVLKRNGYLAAANTEIVPTDAPRTRIRDVWDVAIMRYGDFPIFTRRYAHHGVENFAFDCLLGKPCLIVAHQDFFQDDYTGLIALMKRLQHLNCTLNWQPLGEVLRRACRRRVKAAGVEEIEMYGNELVISNPDDRELKVLVRKREADSGQVAEVRCDEQPIPFAGKDGYLLCEATIRPGSTKDFRVAYREQPETVKLGRSLRFELSVALRRMLSEFRDEHLSRSRLLSGTAAGLKSVLTRAG